MEIYLMQTRCGEAFCLGAARDAWQRMYELGGPESFATETSYISRHSIPDSAFDVLHELHQIFIRFSYSDPEPMFSGQDTTPVFYSSDCLSYVEELLLTCEDRYGVFDQEIVPVIKEWN